MPTTTLDALRTAMRSTIEGIAPDQVRNSVNVFRWVEDADEVKAALRVFTIQLSGDLQFAADRGIFMSDAISYTTELRVVVGYGGLTEHEFQSMKNSDARQLYQSIATAAITGLELVTPQGFEEDARSTKGRRSGAHVFSIDYLLSNQT